MFEQIMPPFGAVEEKSLLHRLQYPLGTVDVVLDTDTYNEIDDQFALAYLILHNEKLRLQAIYAAPFSNEKAPGGPAEGMQLSRDEILHIIDLMKRGDLKDRVYAGSQAYLNDEKTPVDSPAARDLACRAMNYTPESPLYVIAIGAITNIASALLLEPAIRDRITVVWLGGHALHWHDNKEFNLRQDIAAARIVLGCGAAVVLLPCMGVVSAFATTEPELRENLKGKNELCDYLYNYTVSEVSARKKMKCWSKPIWDVTAIGWLLDKHFMRDELIAAPIPEYDGHWGFDSRRHWIRYIYQIERDVLFEDLFNTLTCK